MHLRMLTKQKQTFKLTIPSDLIGKLGWKKGQMLHIKYSHLDQSVTVTNPKRLAKRPLSGLRASDFELKS